MSHTTAHAASESMDAYSIALGELLRLQLTWLSYPAFERCIERILMAHGFEGVRSLGRTALKGRRRVGGADLFARTTTPSGPLRFLVQLKRYKIPVPAHFVHELRGLNVLSGVTHGLIVTTSIFSDPAIDAAEGARGWPIWLIDGRKLGQLMVRYQIGTRTIVDLATGKKKLVLDPDSFECLEASCRESRRSIATPPREVL